MLRSNFQGPAGMGTAPNPRRSRPSVLENGFHFPDGPAFPGRYPAVADQRVRTDLVVGGHDREFGFWFPAEGEVEVAREDLPSRAVIQFDDVALGMGPDPRGAFRVGWFNGVVRSATFVPTGPVRSSCWGWACWLRDGRAPRSTGTPRPRHPCGR